ncbi:MAG: bifunctional DNA-formamidopyrimidine glycosylase/DNA-(apurinic or apyrimidinic site) lyase [Bifidobacteriaceae bacterium]|jgi:formamidopyrimidine-DNA glycosylase|nr:bifunctional DNA-formamidopyrimidine glycosylase/DNA-(apurinic or apyrimidinic site) lyase [Bifidobacteriaceae bacterium]
MPELPEVEVIKRGLARRIVNCQIQAVGILTAKSWQISSSDLSSHILGAKIIGLQRRAKLLIINLNSGFSLLIHLKMTGQLVLRQKINNDILANISNSQNWAGGHPTNSLIGKLPDSSSRIIFTLSDNYKLFFNDQRMFGWIKLIKTNSLNTFEFIKKLGPEPFKTESDYKAYNTTPDKIVFEEFISRIKRHKNSNIKASILDQTVLAGVGNIYADESLWMSKIHPLQKVNNLSDKQLYNLLANIIKVMKLSIKHGGSTARNYVDSLGNRGSYLKFAKVFRREGQLCPRCLFQNRSSRIIKIKVAGRGTHICPYCQKIKT